MIWVMVVLLILGAAGIGWGVYRFDSKETTTATAKKDSMPKDCDELRAYIVAEEEVSYKNWKKYHKSVMKYDTIAKEVTVVLESDLRIYKVMKRLPQCLTNEFRKEMEDWVKSTRETIDYLTKGKEVDGNIFDPEEGFWDTSFYDAFYSATDNLSTGVTNI
jgi:hypothetical protein